jgi:hypothetical protein
LPDARVRLLFDWCVQPSTSLIRRAALRTVRFPESVRQGEDVIFFAQLRDQGRFVHIPEKLTGYRVSAAQQTQSRGHLFAHKRSLFRWFTDNADRYSEAEREYVYGRIKRELTQEHDEAYWHRRRPLALEWRRLYTELFGRSDPPPRTFQKPLYPAPIFRVKDWIDRLLARRPSPRARSVEHG